MLANCFDSVDDWSLIIGRLSIVVVAAWGVYITLRMLKPPKSRALPRVVPRPILWCTLVWLIALLVVTVWILSDGCNGTIGTVQRTALATALTWSLAGVLWVAYHGVRWVEVTRRRAADLAGPVLAELVREIAEKQGGE